MLNCRIKIILQMSFFLFVCTVLQTACAPPAQILRESSATTKPGWIIQPPQSNELLYFTGIKSGTDTLEEGREAAVKDAMAKIAGFLGSKVQSLFEDYSTEIEQNLKQQISSKSSASIFGASVVDWYYEKVVRIDKKFRMEKYDVYVLVSFKKSEVEKELQRQQDEKITRVTTAYDLYSKGLEAEKHKAYQDSHRSYSQALNILNGIDDIVAVTLPNIKNNEELIHIVKARLQEVISKMHRVTLSLKVSGPEKSPQVFQSSLTSALNEKGYTVTQEDPAIEISGEVSVVESSVVMNNYAYYAEGSISARRTSDGQVITVVPVKAKGFHRLKEQAALNSLSEAGIESGKILANSLLEKEDTAK